MQLRTAAVAPTVSVAVKHGAIQCKSAAIPAYLQRKATDTRGNDAAEREADATARTVMTMPAPPVTAYAVGLQRKANDNAPAPSVPRIPASGGVPLSAKTRRFLEPRFNADLGGIMVHADSEAAQLAKAMNARAFTTGNHIYFAANAYQPGTPDGMELLAHELTHTIQQGATVQRKQTAVDVTQRAARGAQKFGFSDVLDFFADKANIIPGYRMFTIILGVNPINMSSVDRSAANILRAMVEFIPGGYLIAQALDKYQVFEKAGTWVEQQISELGLTGSAIRKSLDDFIDSLGWRDLLRPFSLWERAANIVINPIKGIITLAKRVGIAILRFIRDAVLIPLAKLAEGTRGWDLVCALLGKNPITGDAVPQTAETLVPGFMKLINKQEVWQRIQETKALSKIWQWFKTSMAEVIAMVMAFPSKFLATLKSLEVGDFILLPKAIAKILGAFGSFVVGFISWAGNAVWKLLEIIFSVVSPGAWKYIQKLGAALRSILTNPLPFVRNLGKSAKDGFNNFKNGFTGYLQAGLIGWLTGNMPGVYIPKALEIKEIARFGLSVLGLTWVNLRSKLVKAIGETAVAVLETTFDIVVTLVRDGPVAAWEQIKTQLSNLKEMAIGAIVDFIVDVVTKKAIPKLVSMFIPGLGFVSAIISVYDMIMVVVERISQIVKLVTGFIDSISAIASGNTGAASKKIESVLANGLSLAIVFAAGFASIGRVADKVRGVLEKIRAPFDKAMDWLVGWIQKGAKAFVKAAKAGIKKLLNWWKKKVPFAVDGESHSVGFEGEGNGAKLVLRSDPTSPKQFLTNAAKSRPSITGTKLSKPIAKAGTIEDGINETKVKLKEYDDNDKPAAAGKREAAADSLMADLDKKLGSMATHIIETFDGWGVKDGTVKSFELSRGKFSVEHKRKIAENASTGDLKKNKDKELINVKEGLARRHVVSSHDMAKHYASALTGKKISEAKLLLEQRGSIPKSRTPMGDKLTQEAVEETAKTRYGNFFGYSKNIFIGDSKENSSIQEHLDSGHPDMAGKKLEEHVSRIKREWAIDDSIAISRLDEG